MAEKKKKTFKAYSTGRSCPKCGSGVRLAKHETKGQRTRFSCGKCNYTEMV